MSTLRALLLFASLTTLVGCGCSGTLVVHAFEKGNGDPAGLVEVRIEEANRTASGKGSVRLDDVPCGTEPYLVHVSSPKGHFRQVFTRASIQDGRVSSLEVEIELTEKGVAAKKRAEENPVNQVLQGVGDVLEGH
tara:strand:+ start:198 stop:602 length:405 start_codon:yes stop_codon:yes gene_type:complete